MEFADEAQKDREVEEREIIRQQETEQEDYEKATV